MDECSKGWTKLIAYNHSRNQDYFILTMSDVTFFNKKRTNFNKEEQKKKEIPE